MKLRHKNAIKCKSNRWRNRNDIHKYDLSNPNASLIQIVSRKK